MPCGRRTLLALFFGLIITVSPSAHAGFPERPITLIVPFGPGGPADTFARIIGERMSQSLGQPIIIENMAGAGGTTGIARAAQQSRMVIRLRSATWARMGQRLRPTPISSTIP